MDRLKQVRRELSARLAKARTEGRELDEIRLMGREADRRFREAARDGVNGRRRRR